MIWHANSVSSIIFDHLSTRFVGRNDVGIACLYLDYLNPEQQTSEHMLGSLLQQFAAQKPSILSKLEDLAKAMLEEGCENLTPDDTCRILAHDAMKSFDKIYICIDGLNEWEDAPMRDLLQYVHEIGREYGGKLRLFVTTTRWKEYHLEECLGIMPEDIRSGIQKFEETKKRDTTTCMNVIFESDEKEMNEALKNEIISKATSRR